MKFPVFYGTQRLPHSQMHATYPYPKPDQSSPYPPYTSWSSILVWLSHLSLGLPSALFLSGLPTKSLYAPLHSTIRATCPRHLIHLDLITRIKFGWRYRSLSSSLCTFLHSHVTSSLLGPNILITFFLTLSAYLKFNHPVVYITINKG